MVDTRASVWLATRFRIARNLSLCFPSSAMVSERSSPSRVRFAAPNGAPLTAPGRSEERFLPRGKRSKSWKTPAGKHDDPVGMQTHSLLLGESAAPSRSTPGPCGRGWMPWQSFARTPARGGSIFLLTSPFIERQGGPEFSGPQTKGSSINTSVVAATVSVRPDAVHATDYKRYASQSIFDSRSLIVLTGQLRPAPDHWKAHLFLGGCVS